MMFSDADWEAIILSLKLASIVTVLLLVISTPIAWWLARSTSRWKPIINALIALPIVLPSSVLGFYLLILMGPNGPLGQLMTFFGLNSLAFTFNGLVIASIIYSLPFVVHPIQNAMMSMGYRPIEVAATLRATPMDRFFSVVLPQARYGLITAAVLGFAHTLGEFGIILMIGGNIPGETQVVSVQIYEHVEALDYGQAHRLALLMLTTSFVVLLLLYTLNTKALNTKALNTKSPKRSTQSVSDR